MKSVERMHPYEIRYIHQCLPDFIRFRFGNPVFQVMAENITGILQRPE